MSIDHHVFTLCRVQDHRSEGTLSGERDSNSCLSRSPSSPESPPWSPFASKLPLDQHRSLVVEDGLHSGRLGLLDDAMPVISPVPRALYRGLRQDWPSAWRAPRCEWLGHVGWAPSL